MNDKIIKENKEIEWLSSILKNYISSKDIENVAKELYFHIWVKDNKTTYLDWSNGKRVKNVLKKEQFKKLVDLLEKTYNDLHFEYKHDYLCFFVKLLQLTDNNKIPKANIYSHSELREYDPAKNAQNILKHGLSFREILDNHNTIIGDLITHTHSNGEDRNICFSRIRKDNYYKYVIYVCTFPESKFDEYIGEISSKYLSKIHLTNVSQIDISTKSIINIIKDLIDKGIFDKLPKIPALRIISARYFDGKNYEDVIRRAIKDNNLDPSVLNELREQAIKLIQEINEF